MKERLFWYVVGASLAWLALGAYGSPCMAQSSSLWTNDASAPQLEQATFPGSTTVQSPSPEEIAAPMLTSAPGQTTTAPRATNRPQRLAPAMAAQSLMAVPLPQPRAFVMHDLVTIIIRESVESDSEASLDTNKKTTLDGKISAFPKLTLADLLQFQLGQSSMDAGQPQVTIDTENKFEGDGAANRKDTFTARVTAKIIDVKPNGNLVLEARKFIQSDKETLQMTITGTCRSEDVALDNSVLSTQMADLRLIKEHTGELRKATKKGLITRFFDTIFNF